MPEYFDDWKTADFNCPCCRWTGKGGALVGGEVFRDLKELDCPKCGGRITVLEFPTHEEMVANRYKLSDFDRHALDRRIKREADFQQKCLRSASQLPEIVDSSIVLTWDFTDDGKEATTLIKWGDKVIFSEPAFYEGFERFIEVAEVLRQRYGLLLVDLVPSPTSLRFLYGDVSNAETIVAKARTRIFGSYRD